MHALVLRTERQSAQMSKIINCGLEQYGTKPFVQQQFGKGGIKGVKHTQTEKYPQTDTNTHIQTDKHA